MHPLNHINTSFNLLSPPADQETPTQPHQAPDERLHGVVADGAPRDRQVSAGHAQRRDLEAAGPALEAADGGPAEALPRRGRATEAPALAGVP